ncbi:unnamed protein product [Closterium sp. Yama58-4]|nr:unnamed protein product [Closterium sp. Yama58-4]
MMIAFRLPSTAAQRRRRRDRGRCYQCRCAIARLRTRDGRQLWRRPLAVGRQEAPGFAEELLGTRHARQRCHSPSLALPRSASLSLHTHPLPFPRLCFPLPCPFPLSLPLIFLTYSYAFSLKISSSPFSLNLISPSHPSPPSLAVLVIGWMGSQFAILESASVSSSSYSHSSLAYNHGISLHSQEGDLGIQVGAVQSPQSPLSAESGRNASGGDTQGSDSIRSVLVAPPRPSSPAASTSPRPAIPAAAVPPRLALPAAGPGPLCDLYQGRWVHTRQAALYSGEKCGWMFEYYACARSNRPLDMRQYERLRWQPNGCNTTRFSAEGFFERMRNKRIAFVGDSLGQQQFQSLLCVLAPEGPPKNMSDPSSPIQDVSKEYSRKATGPGGRQPIDKAFRFVASNTTVIFRWSALLCDVEPFNKRNWMQGQALHLDQPDVFLKDFLKQLDVVVLNTGHHWYRDEMTWNVLEFYVNGSRAPLVKGQPIGPWPALKIATRSLSLWIDEQLKNTSKEHLLRKPGEGEGREGGGEGGGEGARRKLGSAGVEIPAFAAGGGSKMSTAIFGTPETKPMVLLRSVSPRHFIGEKPGTSGTCTHLKHPFGDAEVAVMLTTDAMKEDGVLGTSVHLLNITHLSAYRGDAHPSVWDPRYDTPKGEDCLH